MFKKFFAYLFSVLTACATGGVVALLGIYIVTHSTRIVGSYIGDKFLSNVISSIAVAEEKEPVEKDTSLLEEADQDPSFISRFSRVFIYSANENEEVIESAKDALPGPANKKITAPSYLVMDLDREAVVLEKDGERMMPIASVSKLVTAVVARKLLDQDESITLTKQALATYGNEARFREGEKFKVKELLYPLLMVSSNDASEILARAYGRERFLEEMNNWVNSIGAYRTYFADPSGLSPQNVSTARDLAIISRWILKNDPEIFDITLEKSKTIRTHTWTNPTHFLNLDSYIGGKNGYTPEANRTSVAIFKLGRYDRLYSVMLIGSSNRDSDILELLKEAVR
jgi:D-alanyl-D-alanine carboxypeptidase